VIFLAIEAELSEHISFANIIEIMQEANDADLQI
jgi:hypothetical protein